VLDRTVIRLVCIDVDGTLLGTGGVLPRVWAAIDRARAAGLRLALCSGRPAFGNTRALAERVDPRGWHVFQNGASILQLATGQSQSARHEPATIARLIARARETGSVLELYSDSDYAVESSGPRARRHAELLGLPFRPRPFETLEGPIVRAQWMVPLEDEAATVAGQESSLEVAPSTAPGMPDTCFVNLTPRGVSKASAVGVLAREAGVPLAEVMFIGDGLNDLGALRAVGYPVAMANAVPEVRQVARLHVPSADEGGVADALAAAERARLS
jgi:Cof subfamily protein (haloacid dehalogenase superfamily)